MKYLTLSFIIFLLLSEFACKKNTTGPASPTERILTYAGGSGIVVYDLDTQEADTFAVRGDSIAIPPNLLGEPYIREYAIQPRWSPDGEWIAFLESFAVDESHIAIMRKDGTRMKVLTSTMGNCWGLSWNPNGKVIIYSKSTAPVGVNYEIFNVNIATDCSTRLTFNSWYDSNPDFSPDGTQIVYEAEDSLGIVQIFIMNDDGSNVEQLTSDGKSYTGPRWSPAGNNILYSQRDDDKDSEIYILNIKNMSVTKLSDNIVHDSGASWSNDGQWIAFVKYSDGWLWINPSIYMMQYNGSDEKLLIERGQNPDLFIK